MTLYMVELSVADLAASVAWYRDALGMTVEHADWANGFALLRGEKGGRLALKAGTPARGARLHFRVPDLAAELARLAAAGVAVTSPPKASPEGYRRATVADPDGHTVTLFQWTGPAAPG